MRLSCDIVLYMNSYTVMLRLCSVCLYMLIVHVQYTMHCIIGCVGMESSVKLCVVCVHMSIIVGLQCTL